MEDTAGQGSRFVCVSGAAASGHLSSPHRVPATSMVLGPLQEPVSTQLLLQAVRKAACANRESDPGTPLLRTLERHSRETPRCSPAKALVPTGRCPGLGCASSLTSSPNRYGLPIAQVACALRCVPTCPCKVTSLPSYSVTACFLEVTSWMVPLTHTSSCHQSERKPGEGSCSSVLREKGVRSRKPRA